MGVTLATSCKIWRREEDKMETRSRTIVPDAHTSNMTIRLIGILFIAGLMLAAGQRNAYSQVQNQPAPAAPDSKVSRALSPDEKSALLSQAENAQAAFNRGDVETVMNITHPAVFRLYGGREVVEQVTRTAFAQLQQLGVKFLSTVFGEPSPAYFAGKEIVCFVPRTSIIQINGKIIRSQAYWVAARPIDATEWKFIDGAGIEHNREALWTMFPELSRDVQFPIWKQELVNQ